MPSLPGGEKYPGLGLVGQVLGCPEEVKASDSFLQCSTVSPVLLGSSSGLPVPLPLLPVSCTAPSAAFSVPKCALLLSTLHCPPLPVFPSLSSWMVAPHWAVTSQQASVIPWVIIVPQAPLPLGSISPVPGNALWMSGFSCCQVPGEDGEPGGWHRSPMRTTACEGASPTCSSLKSRHLQT